MLDQITNFLYPSNDNDSYKRVNPSKDYLYPSDSNYPWYEDSPSHLSHESWHVVQQAPFSQRENGGK